MRKKAWRDWITINDLAGKWDSGFEEAIIDIPIGGYDYASLVDVGDAYSLTLYGNGGGSIGFGWFNTTQEAIDRLNFYFNNIYYDDGEPLPSYNTYLTDPEDLKRQRGAARKYAYTDEQMKVLRDYFEDSERQHLVDADEEDIIHSWETALDLVDATPGRWEWGFAMQVRGLCADSDYLMGWNNGMNIGDERPEPLPEFFPGSGTWSDSDLADAYNAHIPEMYRLFDVAMSVGDVIDEEIEPNTYYYDMTEDEQKRYDELWDEYCSAQYDFCEEHQKAVDDLCAAAQKLLSDANYYWIDSANIDEYINEMAEEWIENEWVYFDED